MVRDVFRIGIFPPWYLTHSSGKNYAHCGLIKKPNTSIESTPLHICRTGEESENMIA
jgi:hypothetical protein